MPRPSFSPIESEPARLGLCERGAPAEQGTSRPGCGMGDPDKPTEPARPHWLQRDKLSHLGNFYENISKDNFPTCKALNNCPFATLPAHKQGQALAGSGPGRGTNSYTYFGREAALARQLLSHHRPETARPDRNAASLARETQVLLPRPSSQTLRRGAGRSNVFSTPGSTQGLSAPWLTDSGPGVVTNVTVSYWR